MNVCVTCGTNKVNLYDERLDVFACDEECLLEHLLHDNAYAMLDIYMAWNVVEVESDV